MGLVLQANHQRDDIDWRLNATLRLSSLLLARRLGPNVCN